MAMGAAYSVNSLGSFPEMTVRTSVLAMASAYSGSFCSAWSSAACDSSMRPRCSSHTACETRLQTDEVAGACASSSKT